jgi:hypothetical protein
MIARIMGLIKGSAKGDDESRCDSAWLGRPATWRNLALNAWWGDNGGPPHGQIWWTVPFHGKHKEQSVGARTRRVRDRPHKRGGVECLDPERLSRCPPTMWLLHHCF